MTVAQEVKSEFDELIADKTYHKFPKVGDVIAGQVIAASRNEVRIDIDGVAVGVVRGQGLYNESPTYSQLKAGDTAEATVLELENENGELELSFREAGYKKTWDELENLVKSGDPVQATIVEANKGGLIAMVASARGFLPVSQLSPDNYPRVQGGDKQKILEKLKGFIGKELTTRVIDIDKKEEKVIVSEKAVWEESKKKLLEKFEVGQTVKGSITALTSFGAFVEFEGVEGLIHISELTWKRINHPSDVVKSGDAVEAQIIEISGAKIFLSVKRLSDDPWKGLEAQMKPGDKVKGKVIKVQPFGLVVEITETVHGLAHISMLSNDNVSDINAVANVGDEMEFEIVEINPAAHRLALKVPGVKSRAKVEKTKNQESEKSSPLAKATDDKEETPAEDVEQTNPEGEEKE